MATGSIIIGQTATESTKNNKPEAVPANNIPVLFQQVLTNRWQQYHYTQILCIVTVLIKSENENAYLMFQIVDAINLPNTI